MVRFFSGMVSPSSAWRNSSVASTNVSASPRPSWSKYVTTSALSSLRIMPLSMCSSLSLPGGSASWKSLAATVESTPPEASRNTPRPATSSRISCRVRSRYSSPTFHVGAHLQMLHTKFFSMTSPFVVESTSTWNWKPYRCFSSLQIAALGPRFFSAVAAAALPSAPPASALPSPAAAATWWSVSVYPISSNPSPSAVTVSKCDIQTVCVLSRPSNNGWSRVMCSVVNPHSTLPPCSTVPPYVLAMVWWPKQIPSTGTGRSRTVEVSPAWSPWESSAGPPESTTGVYVVNKNEYKQQQQQQQQQQYQTGATVKEEREEGER